MPHLLKNENLSLRIDLPGEGYSFSRFDWTGKISEVRYKNRLVSGQERPDMKNTDLFGRGYYNEFGIDTALGFEDAAPGDWFHKIGVGLLKKDSSQYLFHKEYEIRPARFDWNGNSQSLRMSCKSERMNDFAYELVKEIQLTEQGFKIAYTLDNKGDKNIATQEYGHNFIAIDKALIGTAYVLRFPFDIAVSKLEEKVNPEGMVEIGQNEVTFRGKLSEQFFFSNLSGGETVSSRWEIEQRESKVGIRETGSFETNKINLWGWGHVLSPELFADIEVKPGESYSWWRNYDFFSLDE